MRLRKNLPHFYKGLVLGAAIALVFIAGAQLYQAIFTSDSHDTFENETSNPLIQQGMVSYADAVDRAAPAVVNIFTTKIVTRQLNPFFNDPFFRRFFGDRGPQQKRRESSLGSGVIVSERGYVLTNNHVIAGADEIKVALRDGRSVIARLIGTDPESDIAVLHIDLENLPAILLGHSNRLRVGDVVLAIGNPFGVGQTVTQGIVSATGRSKLGIAAYENFIQTDAAINPGNSGGALISPYGALVGINTAIFSKSGGSQGIGFAVPVDTAKNIMTQIIKDGHVRHGWLGIEVQNLTPVLAESFGLSSHHGVIVAGTLRNGPADNSGIRTGDILLSFNGQTITDAIEAMNMIAQTPPGNSLKVGLFREGKSLEITADIGERPRR